MVAQTGADEVVEGGDQAGVILMGIAQGADHGGLGEDGNGFQGLGELGAKLLGPVEIGSPHGVGVAGVAFTVAIGTDGMGRLEPDARPEGGLYLDDIGTK